MPKKIVFQHKILIIGYGAVSRCTLPLLFQHIDVPHTNVTIIDFGHPQSILQEWLEKGVHYYQIQVTANNMQAVLSEHVDAGGMIIDLAWNIETISLLRWCYEHEVLYLNTSVEEWDPFENIREKPIVEKTLYWRQMHIREAMAQWKKSAVTAVVDHGANPGLISHFTKQGLIDIAEKCLVENTLDTSLIKPVEVALNENNFAQLAMHLGVKVIHCSERDTQRSNQLKRIDEFVNTWSIEGLVEEGMAPAELGWGTHEKELPSWAFQPDFGPKNQIFLAQMGINTWMRSWIPEQEILGMMIRHGEAFGLSDYLTVWKKESKQEALYRPTVHYVYMPTNDTLMSLHELRARNYDMLPHQRIVNDEIVAGEDILGALIMGHAYQSWWTGSILSIEAARQLVPHQNATTVQVAIGVVAALLWMIENPRKGVCLPEHLPHEKVLAVAKPYLGKFVSEPFDWAPTKHFQPYFKERRGAQLDKETPWVFKNFLFQA